MPRLPQPGKDAGEWGAILNDFLSSSLAADGSLRSGSVGSSQLQANSVTNSAIAPSAVTAASLAPGAVTTAALSDNAITTSKISDGSITAAKVAADVATQAELDALAASKLDVGVASSTYARPFGQSVVLMGDSLTAYNGGPSVATPRQALAGSYDSKGAFNWANVMLRHGFRVIGNAGIGGQTTLNMASRFTSDVIVYSPDWVVILAGTNDGPSAASGSNTVAATTANLTSMYAAASSAGIRIVACTIPPNTPASSAQRAYYLSVNRWIRDYCRNHPGILLADIGAGTYDPATTWQALGGMMLDGTHPNTAGAIAWGRIIADTCRPYMGINNDLLGCSSGDPTNLLTNPLLVGTGTTPGSGWSKGGTGTLSYVARTDGVTGSWCQLAGVSGSGVNLTSNVTVNGSTLSIGDTIYAAIEFECDSLEISAPANTQSISLRIQFWNGASFFSSISDLYWDASYVNGRYPITSGVLMTPPFSVPATSQIAQFIVSVGGAGNYRFHRAAVRKTSAGNV